MGAVRGAAHRRARTPSEQAANRRLLRQLGVPAIPPGHVSFADRPEAVLPALHAALGAF